MVPWRKHEHAFLKSASVLAPGEHYPSQQYFIFHCKWLWGEGVTREPGSGAVHVSVPNRLFIDRLSIASLSHAYVRIALDHSAPERVEATFCSAGRTVRIGLLVMGRLRSPGCVMLISISVFFSRSRRTISMRPRHPVHCTRRAAKGLRDINGRLAAERRQKGREACMRRSEGRAVRTPWRQERRQRYAQERRHLL